LRDASNMASGACNMQSIRRIENDSDDARSDRATNPKDIQTQHWSALYATALRWSG